MNKQVSAEIPQDKVANYLSECRDALQSQKAVTAYFQVNSLFIFYLFDFQLRTCKNGTL